MNTQRKEKIQNAARKIIAEYLTQELPDEEKIFWLINLSEVNISSDYSYLDVHVSAFHNQDQLTKILALHAHTIQRNIWKWITLRKYPKVRFRYDEMWAIGSSVMDKINTLDTNSLEKKFQENNS